MTTEPKHGLKRYIKIYGSGMEDLEGLPPPWPESEHDYFIASEADALIAAKDAEIAGLREDAARYRWVRENLGTPELAANQALRSNDGTRVALTWQDALDAQVDAARSKQEP